MRLGRARGRFDLRPDSPKAGRARLPREGHAPVAVGPQVARLDLPLGLRCHRVMRAGAVEKRGHFRRRPRAGRRVAVHYALLIGEGEARHRGDDRQAFTLNIGLGGAFVETADPEAPGSLLAVDLVVPPDGRVITIHADVRWATDATDGEPHGMGIRFHGLDEEQSAVLGEYFASLVPTVDHDEAP